MLRAIYILLFSSLLFVLPQDANAQKRKKKSERKVQREAEFYFTEAQKYFILEDFQKALVLFEQARDIDPDNAAVYYKMAEIYENNDELSKALTNISQALKKDDTNKYYYLLAANIQTRLGNFDEAAALYEEMLGKIDNTEQYLFELAAIYIYQDKPEKALQTYQRAESYFGVNNDISSQKQKLLLQLNDVNGAIEEGKKLVEYDPEDEAAVLGLAELLISVERSNEAITLLEDHLKEFPDHSIVSMFLGNIYLKANDLQKAEAYLIPAFESPLLNINAKIQTLAIFRMELKSENNNSELPLKLARTLVIHHNDIADAHSVYGDLLYALGKHEEARREYVKALKIDKSSFTLWQNILQLYLYANKYDSVITLSDQAMELFPNQGAIYYYNGLANLRNQNYNESVVALKHGKLLTGGDPKLMSAFNSMLGEAYHKLKEYKKSEEAFNEALENDPDNPMVLNNFSYYLASRNENLEKAFKMSKKLIEKHPNINEYLDTHAWVLYHQQKYNEAAELMKKIIESGNAKASHHDHFGDILYKMGKIDDAVEHWKIAREKDSSLKNIDKKIADRKIYE